MYFFSPSVIFSSSFFLIVPLPHLETPAQLKSNNQHFSPLVYLIKEHLLPLLPNERTNERMKTHLPITVHSALLPCARIKQIPLHPKKGQPNL